MAEWVSAVLHAHYLYGSIGAEHTFFSLGSVSFLYIYIPSIKKKIWLCQYMSRYLFNVTEPSFRNTEIVNTLAGMCNGCLLVLSQRIFIDSDTLHIHTVYSWPLAQQSRKSELMLWACIIVVFANYVSNKVKCNMVHKLTTNRRCTVWWLWQMYTVISYCHNLIIYTINNINS